MPKFLNITGQRFGRLVPLEPLPKTFKHSNKRWLCQCDCGERTVVASHNLGRTRSCGCLARELTAARSVTHGQEGTPTYRVWSAMLSRCRNPNHKSYSRYGGRGVGIDDPNWFSFQKFFGEMGEQPPGCDLHRKDNDKGYSKGNCVWLPHSEHMRLNRFKPRARD
jgi:hypothetical protein